MPDRKAIERGYAFEDHVAKVLGGKKQPGSGNKFYAQSDVIANGLLISCKSEKEYTYKQIISHLYEAVDMAYGTGNIPALAFEEAGNEFVLMRLSDFAKAFQEEISIPVSKSEEKRARANIPLMLREQ